MFFNNQFKHQVTAINKSMAIIQFDLDGKVTAVNDKFATLVGYAPSEIIGRHHSLFVQKQDAESPAYNEFWAKLRRGEYDAGRYKRIGKGGSEVWIEASYNPLINARGKPYAVVKYAADISGMILEKALADGQIDAIGKAQAVIHFEMDGTIKWANDNFLNALGYHLSDISGRHHSMFVSPDQIGGQPYKEFWDKLRQGNYDAGRYKRIGKGGREVWIQASYNPILDMNGKPVMVVKYATDITEQIKLLDDLKVIIDRNFGDIDIAINKSSEEANSATAAARDATDRVQTVAAASEELAASVGEISASMGHSRAAADRVHSQSMTAQDATQRLAVAAKAMDGVVSTIQGITDQIKLLALNATIEAARAGDAGKGFAVVANEVKSLAEQAATANEGISGEIATVQKVAQDVVEALQIISAAAETVRESVTATSAAVEEQSVVTQDMSSNMQSAASSVASIISNVEEIALSVGQSAHAVSATRDAAKILTQQ